MQQKDSRGREGTRGERERGCATRLDSLITSSAETRPRSSYEHVAARADLARCTYADYLFSATAIGFPAESTNVARFYKVVIFVKIRLLDEFDSNGNLGGLTITLHSRRADLSENYYVATANNLKKNREITSSYNDGF